MMRRCSVTRSPFSAQSRLRASRTGASLRGGGVVLAFVCPGLNDMALTPDESLLQLQLVCKSIWNLTQRRGSMRSWLPRRISRRGVLSAGMAAGGGSLLAGLGAGHRATAQGVHANHNPGSLSTSVHPAHGHMVTVGEVDNARNGFDPTVML